MTTTPDIQQDNWGILLRAPVTDQDGNAVDLTGATEMVLRCEFPSDVRKDFDAFAEGDPTLGVLAYVVVDGDLEEYGPHRLQGRITKAGVYFLSTTVVSFPVSSNLPAPAAP